MEDDANKKEKNDHTLSCFLISTQTGKLQLCIPFMYLMKNGLFTGFYD